MKQHVKKYTREFMSRKNVKDIDKFYWYYTKRVTEGYNIVAFEKLVQFEDPKLYKQLNSFRPYKGDDVHMLDPAYHRRHLENGAKQQFALANV